MIKNNNSKPKVIISNKGLSIKKLGKNTEIDQLLEI